MPETEARIDRKYVGILCLVSLAILFAGVWFRPPRTQPPVQAESERLNVQIASQRRELERRTLFYANKVNDLVPLVREVRTYPERAFFRGTVSGQNLLLVADGPNGQQVWAVAQAAGNTETRCDEMPVAEIATTINIPSTLADGVAFDFDNAVTGIVMPCGERRILTTATAFRAWTAERLLVEALRDCCGLEIDQARVVLSISVDSQLFKAGLRQGDVIAAVAEKPVSSRAELRAAITSSTAPYTLEIERSGRTRKLTVQASETEAR